MGWAWEVAGLGWAGLGKTLELLTTRVRNTLNAIRGLRDKLHSLAQSVPFQTSQGDMSVGCFVSSLFAPCTYTE